MKTLKLNTWLYTVTALFLAVALLLSGLGLSFHTMTAISKVSASTAFSTLHIVVEHLNDLLSDTFRLCAYMQTNPVISSQIKVVVSEDAPLYERYSATNTLNDYLTTLCVNNDSVKKILVKTADRTYRSEMEIRPSAVLEVFESTEEIVLHLPEDNAGFADKASVRLSDLMYYSFRIMDADSCLAEVCVVLDHEVIAEMFAPLKEYAVIGPAHTPMFYHEETWGQMQPLYQTISGVDRYVTSGDVALYMDTTQNEEFTILYYRSLEHDAVYIWRLLLILLISTAAAMGLFVFFSFFLHENISRPIEVLIKELKCLPDTISIASHQISGRFSLRDNLFLCLVMTVAVPALTFLILFTGMTQNLLNQVYTDSYEKVTLQIANTTESYLNKKQVSLTHVAVDPIVLTLPSLDVSKLQTDAQRENLTKLHLLVRENTFLGLDDDHLELYYPDGRLYLSNSVVSGDLPESYFEQRSPFTWYSETDSTGNMRMCFFRELASLQTNEVLGYGKLSVSSMELEHMIMQLNQPIVSLQVMDEHETEIFGYANYAVNQRISDPISYTLPLTGWRLTVEYETVSLYSSLLALYALYVLFLVLILFVASFPLSKSLGRISLAMSSLQIGDVESLLQETFRIDEFNDIASYFNRMALQIESLIDEILISNQNRIQIESQKNHAEIIALQAQINPHFLSNTIEMIIMTIEEGQAQKAKEMLHDMSCLFRYGISKSNLEIPVREELIYTKAYANIMQKRYSKFVFHWNIAEDVEACNVIKLILQPIVENAIYHGVRKKESKGDITIESYRTETNLIFRITDTGIGMTADRLAEVRGYLADSLKSDRIGICNVNKRIKLTYGEAYGVDIESTFGIGTEVTLRLPIQ